MKKRIVKYGLEFDNEPLKIELLNKECGFMFLCITKNFFQTALFGYQKDTSMRHIYIFFIRFSKKEY